MSGQEFSQQLQTQIEKAAQIKAELSRSSAQSKLIPLGDKAELNIVGGQSKNFLGKITPAETLDVSQHHGIISYEPTELFITARAGTTLNVIEKVLQDNHQMLPFEPPHFSPNATIGGTMACDLSGPRRPYTGSTRDFMLGCHLINGRAQLLKFGGEVMKNVAGYDVSRLMTGAMGTLGVLLDVSLKILPAPEKEVTVSYEISVEESLKKIHQWRRANYPISATCFNHQQCWIRLSGSSASVNNAQKKLGGEIIQQDEVFWNDLKEQKMYFFQTELPLWRLSLPSNTLPLGLNGEWLYEWDGAQRWLVTDESADTIRQTVASINGHATLFRGGDAPVFHPLSSGLLAIHRQLKQAFDPFHLFNPGRLYQEL
ncbi:MAG: glycolate oxidase subunit GlcE [Methylococcales bacterium]|nr:glycolate oxidase subunit GlcE [Methylococcales bacterium]MBT7409617.1 glycolate oxidase subunit GlcE [Methylococcales bacterium]